MSLRKSLGILVFSTQAVIAVDYNMQSHQAGLGPGELSMSDYAAIVKKRYDKEPGDRISVELQGDDQQGDGLWRKLAGIGADMRAGLSGGTDAATGSALAEADLEAAKDAPVTVCIRRGTSLDCQ